MAKNDTQAVAEKLAAIVESVEKVKELSSHAEGLVRSLGENGRISEEQLAEFRKSTEIAQEAVAQVVAIGTQFGPLVDSGTDAIEGMKTAGGDLRRLISEVESLVGGYNERLEAFSAAAATSLNDAVKALVADFRESLARVQDSLSVAKSLLIESLATVGPKIQSELQPTITELHDSALRFIETSEVLRTGLEGIPELVAGRIEKLAQPSIHELSDAVGGAVGRLNTLFEPAMQKFVESMHAAETEIRKATEAMTREMHEAAVKSAAEFAGLSSDYSAAISRADSVAGRMEGFLDNSAAFAELVTAVERNLALTIEVDKLLVSKKQPILSRIDFVFVGSVGGFFIGREILNTSDAKVAIVLLPGIIMGLVSEPLITSFIKNIRHQGKKNWSPPAPPRP